MIAELTRLTCRRAVPIGQLAIKLNCSEKEINSAVKVAREIGSSIRITDGYVSCNVPISAGDVVRLGTSKPGRYQVAGISDTHFGSAHCDEGAILEFLRRAWKAGARVAYHSGDLLDGNKPVLLPDQKYVGFDHQVERAVRTIAAAPRFRWVAIDGNHDGYFSAASGLVCGRLVETEMRAAGVDWTFAGVCQGRAVLHGARYHLWHPSGGAGTRNAVRRIMNERAESMVEAADVLVIGHYHRFSSFQAYPERIFCVSGGTYQQKASEFANRITRAWDIGGVVVSHSIARDGEISGTSADFYASEMW